ncbi:universal stress protein [Sphaerisporangium dianthi]|uniref:Universal stress protein n=1 Tax=Sphaerisporangium dianthi TaxID=1436120 RepID=A0ABV9CLB7_9ACTN
MASDPHERNAVWSRSHVVLIEDVIHGHPGKAPVEASADADLVVIGARPGLRAVFGLDATTDTVIDHALAPVAVARP